MQSNLTANFLDKGYSCLSILFPQSNYPICATCSPTCCFSIDFMKPLKFKFSERNFSMQVGVTARVGMQLARVKYLLWGKGS